MNAVDDPYAAIRQAAAVARESGTLGSLDVAGVHLRVLPIPAIAGELDCVLVGAFTLADIPKVYVELAGDTSPWCDLVALLPGIVLTARPDGRVDYYNRHWKAYTGDTHFPSTTSIVACVASDDVAAFLRDWRHGIAQGLPFQLLARLKRAGGDFRWHRFSAQPLERRGAIVKWVVVAAEVHDEIEARNTAQRATQRLRFLAEAGRALHKSFEPSEVAKTACELAVPRIAAAAALRFEYFGGTATVVEPGGRGEGQDLEALLDAPHQDLVLQTAGKAWAASAVVPLRARGTPIGCLAFAFDAVPSSEDLQLVEEFGERVSLALHNACMYSNERRIALTLQAQLLPADLPQPCGVRIDAAYFPCEDEARVGGDWYDAFELHDGRLAITIGDVAGHGISAAAMMGRLRHTIRAALMDGASPAKSLGLANEVAFGGGPELATAFVGIADLLSMELDWAVAGHPPAALVADEGVEFLDGQGIALGILQDLDVRDHRYRLPPRGAIALYTDGVVEYSRNVIEGTERLRERLSEVRDCMSLEAGAIARAVMGQNPHIDDAAVLVLCFEPVRELDMVIPAKASASEKGRRALLRFARGWSLDASRTGDVVLACSEALNNAIEHAYRGRSGMIHLRARGDEKRLLVTVSDNGNWSDRPPHEDRGRGIHIMEALANRVEIERSPAGTSVRVAFEVTPEPVSEALLPC